MAVIPWFALGKRSSLCPSALWLALGSGLSLWSGSLTWSLTQPHGVEVQGRRMMTVVESKPLFSHLPSVLALV